AHAPGGDRHLVRANRAAVEPDLAGSLHGSGPDAGLQLLHAQPRGCEGEAALEVTDHDRRVTDGQQTPADRAAADQIGFRRGPADANVQLEMSGGFADLRAEDAQQRQGRLTPQAALERSTVVHHAAGRRGAQTPDDLQPFEAEPPGLTPNADRAARLPLLAGRLETNGLQLDRAARRPRIARGDVE